MKNQAVKSAFVLSLVVAAAAASAAQYAYLVGVCDYPTPLDARGNPLKDEKGEPIDNDLRGCINDANAIQDLLTSKYNFSSSNIRKSYDKDANGKNFIANVKWLIESAKAGDDIVFYFSGHGAQIEDANAKEEDPADKINEALVLADGTLVVDDLFDELKTILVARGVNATFMFDCCFSGGMARPGLVLGRSSREKLLQKSNLGANYKAMTRSQMNGARPQVTGRSVLNRDGSATGSWAFIYASVESEPSVDLGPVGDSPAHGLFTLVLKTVLAEQPKIAANPLVAAIRDFTIEKGFKQGPNADFSSEARANAPIFPGAK